MSLKIIAGIILSDGWRRRLIAFFAGLCGALAMAPIDFFPAFIIPMSVAVWLLDGSHYVPSAAGARRRLSLSCLVNAASSGWWMGFGYFLAGLWWLGIAFLVDAERFAWALPLCIVGLPAGLALFTSIGFVLARLLWVAGPVRILALALGLSVSEWLRGHMFSGFPWNDFGMVLGGNLYLAQIASSGGLILLTFLSVLIFAAPALLPERSKSARIMLIGCMVLLIGLGIYGVWRIPTDPVGEVAGVSLRLVQPNLSPGPDFRYDLKDKLVGDYLSLSDRATSPQNSGLADVTHIMWAETALPFFLTREPALLSRIATALPTGTILLTGAARPAPPLSNKQPSAYNSIQMISADGTLTQEYDKIHLVPFGEYTPFADLLRKIGLQQFTMNAYTPGAHRLLMRIPGLPPALPLICYESIFSDSAFADDHARPGLIFNVTDDAWYGNSSGPYQHLAMARLRSIEQGLPLVRVANSGISAIIDPFGRYIATLPLGAKGVIDSRLPVAIEETNFVKLGSWIGLTFWIIALFSLLLMRVRI